MPHETLLFAKQQSQAVKEGGEAVATLVKSVAKQAKNYKISVDRSKLTMGVDPTAIKIKKKPATTQILGKGPDSTTLGKNLEATGITRPDNTAAHHIVAGTDKRAATARAILKKEGIDINAADNGVFLPRSSKYAKPPATTHSKVHTNKYYENLTSRLQNSPDVKNELLLIRDELLKGTFPY